MRPEVTELYKLSALPYTCSGLAILTPIAACDIIHVGKWQSPVSDWTYSLGSSHLDHQALD